MAAAQILVGLTTLTTAETLANNNFERIGDTSGGGQAALDLNPEIKIQGTNSITRLVRTNTGGTQCDLSLESSTQTITTTDPRHFYVWIYNLANAFPETVANGGYRIYLAGNGNENTFGMYYVAGADTLPLGGWKCYVATLRQTPPDISGSFGGEANLPLTVTHAGAQATMAQVVSRFQNFALDAIRIGTGLTVYNGDAGNNEANAAGISSFTSLNDDNLNKYGVCEATSSGASIQGKIGIGLDDTSTETYYKDSNIVIINPNKNPLSEETTPFFNTLPDFTGVSVEGGLTTCFFNNVFFNSVDNYDKGYFSCSEGTNEPAKVAVDGCTFQNWGPTTLSGFSTATNTTWISCEGITLNSGVIDNCSVETGVGGTYVFAAGTPDNIKNTSFICPIGGGGHAFEVTQSGEYTFEGNQFTETDGTPWVATGDNAAVHINGAGIAVTFNITGGDPNFTFKLTGTSIDPTFNALVNVNVVGLPTTGETDQGTEIRVLAREGGVGINSELNTDGSIAAGVVGSASSEYHLEDTGIYSFQLPLNQNFDLRILNIRYVPFFLSDQTASTNPTNIPVDLKIDRVYKDDTPPTGLP